MKKTYSAKSIFKSNKNKDIHHNAKLMQQSKSSQNIHGTNHKHPTKNSKPSTPTRTNTSIATMDIGSPPQTKIYGSQLSSQSFQHISSSEIPPFVTRGFFVCLYMLCGSINIKY